MSSDIYRKIILLDHSQWAEWRESNPSIKPDLSGADFSGFGLSQYDLSESNLSNAIFKEASLVCAMLIKADLRGADLRRCNLTGADLFGSNLGQVKGKSSNFENTNAGNSEISEANISDSHLVGVRFSRCNMESTNFSNSDIRGAEFDYSIGYNVNLFNTDLGYASFARTKLTDCDLRYSKLNKTTFEGAILVNVDFSNSSLDETKFGDTVFINCKLRGANYIESCEFSGPCYVDSNTLKKGPLPESFLIGCGLASWEIKAVELFNEDLTPVDVDDILYKMSGLRNGKPIVYGGVFVSYSSQDSKFAETIVKRLQSDDIRCWRDAHDALSGRLDKQIERAITINQIVLLILSRASVKSDWVEWEVSIARQVEKDEGKDRLCPIALDGSWENCQWSGPLRKQIEKYNILDFSEWRLKDKFERQYQKLIKGIGLFY
jgi:uncharacterized protein YjbI with pentapeptide repeats